MYKHISIKLKGFIYAVILVLLDNNYCWFFITKPQIWEAQYKLHCDFCCLLSYNCGRLLFSIRYYFIENISNKWAEKYFINWTYVFTLFVHSFLFSNIQPSWIKKGKVLKVWHSFFLNIISQLEKKRFSD